MGFFDSRARRVDAQNDGIVRVGNKVVTSTIYGILRFAQNDVITQNDRKRLSDGKNRVFLIFKGGK